MEIGNYTHDPCSLMTICDHFAGKNPLIIKKWAFAITMSGADQNIKLIYICGAVFHTVTGWHSEHAVPHIGS